MKKEISHLMNFILIYGVIIEAFQLLLKVHIFYNKFYPQNINYQQMKAIDSSKKSKNFYALLRPSQSLHGRFLKSNPRDLSKKREPRSLEQLTICIIYKKKRIQFHVANKTPFQQLNRQLYLHLHSHLVGQLQYSAEKAEKMLKLVVGFQSVDGDINFDYRLSLQKGLVQRTKFFYPFINKNNSNDPIKYKIYHCLAIGGFSKVYLARSYENGQFYAIKFIKKSFKSDYQEKDKYQSLRNQIKVSQGLDHPFLVKLLHAFETDNFYCMVFQYCPGGQLFYLLKKVKIMSEQIAKFYFLQILFGIQYMHSNSILYRDLKPENILIDADGNCKIVDFGLAKKIDARTKTFSYCGSAEYMAPQMILRTGHSFGIDYYSLGALLYELVTGLPPFYTKDHEELQESIICKQLSFPSHIELSVDIKDLLKKLLNKEQKHRLGAYIGIRQIICHPWMGKVKSASILSKEIKSPHVPNLEEYNFDATELGDDEEEFTLLVHADINSQSNKKMYFYQQFFKNTNLTQFYNSAVKEILSEKKDSVKQSKEEGKQNSFLKLKYSQSKENLKSISRTNTTILQKMGRNQSKQKLIRANNTEEDRRTHEIYRLSPYLSCKQASPKKKRQILNYIENRMNKIERPQVGRKLKRMRLERNKLETDQIC